MKASHAATSAKGSAQRCLKTHRPPSEKGRQTSAPIYAGWAVQFELTDGSIMIGRRVGTTIVPEPNLSQRVDGDVVVFVNSENEPLRTCILDSTTYDRNLDEEDG